MSENFSYINLSEDEKVLISLKKHWIILGFLACYALVVIILSIFFIGISHIVSGLIGEKSFWLFWVIFILISSCIGLSFWLHSELDRLIVTNKKIVSIEQVSVFHREITEMELSKIQEIKSTISGILPSIFHFGNISIFTANNTNNIVFTHTPEPSEIIKKINIIIQNSQKNQ